MANPKIEVRLVQQIRGDFKIVIYLQSEVKANLRTMGELNPGEATGRDDLIRRVGFLTGLIAERQNQEHGDNHDLSRCHSIAQELFIEAVREYGQRRQDLIRSVDTLVKNPEMIAEGKTAHVSAKSD